jgi:hypothetical protein
LASLRYRSGGWDLRYRERSGKERTERFRGGSSRRPPPSALERKGAVEAQLIRGTYVARDLREQTFRVYYDRWVASRQISALHPSLKLHEDAHVPWAEVNLPACR